ncbi:hypothetical protein [Acidithiobacillus caldus]|uniref:hypothetical protein n=1 Tax=Acidithiobacillus caldus TaxID=33059 RepID=UPI00114D3AE5|nr:hypothetical protein [Acidithiobacillus caldus]
MRFAHFIFPRDLSVSTSELSDVLLIGSCFIEDFSRLLSDSHINFHVIVKNNAAQLPSIFPENMQRSQMRVVQIPIRHVLTDAFMNPDLREKIGFEESLDNEKKIILTHI